MKEDESSLTSGGVVSPGGFWHAVCSAQPRVYEFHDNKTRLNHGGRGQLSFTSGSAEELAWCWGVFSFLLLIWILASCFPFFIKCDDSPSI